MKFILTYTVIDMRRLFLMLLILGCTNAIMVPTTEVTVNGSIFHDLNRNGVWDSGEDGLSGITVNVVDENGSVRDFIETGAGGYYKIDLLCFPWDVLWVEPELPITVEHTGEEERYEFPCTNGTNIYSLFGVRILTCEDDEDCYDKSWCSEGLCLHLNCSEGYVAVKHQCIPEYECSSPNDCEYDETCSAGMCEALYCADLEGYVIEEHKCILIEPELECTVDDGCEDDEICSENACVKITCPEDYVVENHTCVYVPPAPECTVNADCAEDEGCYEGECVSVVPPAGCVLWYDGCNGCRVVDGKVTGCTEMYCEEYRKPGCTAYSNETIEEIPKENITGEIPPEEEVPGEVPEEEKVKPSPEVEETGGKVTTEMILVALLILAAVIVVTYMVLYKKK